MMSGAQVLLLQGFFATSLMDSYGHIYKLASPGKFVVMYDQITLSQYNPLPAIFSHQSQIQICSWVYAESTGHTLL